jgi:hypothetical protein
MRLKIVMLLLCAGAFYTLVAKNPIIPNEGANDPHINIENHKVTLSDPDNNSNQNSLIYLNEDRLEKVKDLIAKDDTFFTDAYRQLIVEANKELNKTANPVTNKTQIPPSGDNHDYLSIAPYR